MENIPYKEEFRRLREHLGTQTEVGELLGVHLQTISKIERGVEGYGVTEYKKRTYIKLMEEELLRRADEDLERKRKLQGIV